MREILSLFAVCSLTIPMAAGITRAVADPVEDAPGLLTWSQQIRERDE